MNDTNLLPKLPPTIDYTAFLQELIRAHQALATLDTTIQQTWHEYRYDGAVLLRESLASLKLDGAVLSLEDYLDCQAGVAAPTERIRTEVRHANRYQSELLLTSLTRNSGTYDEKWLKKMHQKLTLSDKNADKEFDEFRHGEIEMTGSTNMYRPPVQSDVSAYIANMFDYFYNQDELDDLVKIAICHYQFEAIQPFSEDNGRVGRLWTQSMLKQKGLVSKPGLLLSSYFEENQQSYYEALRGVSQQNDWNGWITYFLKAIVTQAHASMKLIEEARHLNERLKPTVLKASNEYGPKVYEMLLMRPAFTANNLREYARIDAAQTAYNIIDTLLKERIITDVTPDRQRGKRYECPMIIRGLYTTKQRMY